MKRFVIFVCVAIAVPVYDAAAAGGFPFLHTRPKPVLLESPPSDAPAVQTHAVYHPQSQNSPAPPSTRTSHQTVTPSTASGAHLSDLFTRAWHFGESTRTRPVSASK